MNHILYAKHEHGGHPVEKLSSGFVVHWPSGPVAYRSARQTIAALVNGVAQPVRGMRFPHRSFRDYFGSLSEVGGLDVFSLFTPPPTIIVPRKIGIDLDKRGHEVKKLFYAGFASRVVRSGYDPEEVLQEVYAGILVRNKGKCPFDPQKSSFGHYVHMVTECILSNYHRKHSSRLKFESIGTLDHEGEEEDVGSSDLASVSGGQEEGLGYEMALRSLEGFIEEAAREVDTVEDVSLIRVCLALMQEGHTRWEVIQKLSVQGVNRNRIGRTVDFIRSVAGRWGLKEL